MGKVLVELQGGLGNQMFQYAVGRALALFQGSELLLDTRVLERPGPQTPRIYGLGAFAIRARCATQADLRQFQGRVLAEPGPRFAADITRQEGDVYLRGYWQCERYFRALRPVLRSDFRLSQPPAERNQALARSMLAANARAAAGRGGGAVALHVRRGDYISRPDAAAHHGNCSLDYYRHALETLAARHGALHAYAFSDEPDWVERFLRASPGVAELTVVRGNDDAPHEDLWLMQQARHHVIANSSFSWWGAWLGQGPASSVIAPQRWVQTPGFDTRDVVPEHWARLAA